MIYFVNDLSASVTRMVRFLKPGGVLCVVVTDETVGYTGLALKSFIERGGDTGDNARHLSGIAERRRLLGLPAEGGGAIAELLGAAGIPVEINVGRQPSRLYGHNLADLIALSRLHSSPVSKASKSSRLPPHCCVTTPKPSTCASKTTAPVKACGASPNRNGSPPCVERARIRL